MTQARRAAAVLLSTGLGLGVVGCGQSEAKTEAPATRSPSSATPSESGTPTPTPTPTQRPLSRYESTPQVKVIRAWAAGFGKSVNANDRSMKALAPSVTGDPARFAGYVDEEFGLYYPGPLPLTPVSVKVTGATASVPTCVWSGGWGQKRATKLPATRKAIIPVKVYLQRAGGAWKVQRAEEGRNDCSSVPVKGVAW